MKKQRREGLPARVEQALELPAGTLTDHLRGELIGNRRLVLEGCRRMLEYEDDRIRLDTAGGELRLLGQGLCVEQFSQEGTVITGRLLSLEFLGEVMA